MFAPPSSSRKRKRGEDRLVIGSPFVVQPHIASSFDVSTKVSPTAIIPRSHIPLNWLAGTPSRLFDAPTELPTIAQPGCVVVVKIEGERQLSAVEKVGENVYALYRLSTQLRMKDIRKVASQTKHVAIGDGIPSNYDLCESEWWSEVGSADYPFGDSPVNHAALDMGMGLLEQTTEATEASRVPLPPSPAPPPAAAAEKQTEAMQIDEQPTMSEVLDQVRRQYFDTLYLAKTSLAYFAKSTLSRARATCNDSGRTAAASGFDELAQFLRNLMLPLDKMDLKYRKSLVQRAVENEVEDPTVFRPEEDGYVQRWRQATFQDRFIKENDPELKQKLEELRIRETELQIILLLEVIALNKEHPPAITEVVEKSKGKKSKSKSKKKKSKDSAKVPEPDLFLDLLVDRLCIWHSIGSGTSAEKGESPAKGKGVVSEKDHLRHFSVEVIMAFYYSKLPELCASINKKFGGSSSKPASSVQRPIKAPRDRRAVSRKSSGLTRSDTKGSISRGTTAEPLSILAAESAAAAKTVRGGTLNSRSFAKKIVQVDNKPAQKKVEEELRNVIQALAKPNRFAAAVELADDAERRLKANAKKTKKPTKSLGKVHVAATPQKRKMGFFDTEEVNPSAGPLPKHKAVAEVAATPPLRRQTMPPAGDGAVLATPRKSLFVDLQSSAIHQPRAPPRSMPTDDADTTIFATPVKKQSGTASGFWSPCGGVAIAKETPLKRALAVAKETPLKGDGDRTSTQGDMDVLGETSIYDALGWEDSDA